LVLFREYVQLDRKNKKTNQYKTLHLLKALISNQQGQ
jgi:hypothetical protein